MESTACGNDEPTGGPVEVSVLVEDDHLEAIEDVAAGLARAGLRVGQMLEAAGVINGSLEDAQQLDALKRIEGVASVEVARTFQLPPPDEPVQ